MSTAAFRKFLIDQCDYRRMMALPPTTQPNGLTVDVVKNFDACHRSVSDRRMRRRPVATVLRCDMSAQDFPKRLPEKLKVIREQSGLTLEEFAPHVNAKDGKAIQGALH